MLRVKSLFPLFFFALLLTLPASAQQRREISELVPLDADGRVMIDTYKGSIDVTTWDREEVSIDAVIEADENRELVSLTEVRIERSGNTLRIESDYRKAKKKGSNWRLFGDNNMSLPFVHYTIRMPRTADLNIDDYKSDIDVEALQADFDLETYKGAVKIHDVTGDVRVETYKGNVDVTELAGSLDAETYKGNIDVEFVDFAGHSNVETYRGDIRLHLPRNTGFDLNADLGRGGDLDTDFRLDNVRIKDNVYRGQIGGGGPGLDVDTYRGHVQLAVR